MKLLIGILRGYPEMKGSNERVEAVRATWLKDIPAEAYFLAGGGPERIEGDTIYLDCEPYYENIPERVILFMRYACANLEFDWLFRCDDDTYVDWEEFERTEFDGHYFGRAGGTGKPAGEDYIFSYHLSKVHDDKYRHMIVGTSNGKTWGHGGWGYFLSRHATEIVANYRGPLIDKMDELGGFEDKLVGDILDQAGIELIPTNHFGTHHPVGPEAMLAFHEGRVIKYQDEDRTYWQPVPKEVYDGLAAQEREKLGLPG